MANKGLKWRLRTYDALFMFALDITRPLTELLLAGRETGDGVAQKGTMHRAPTRSEEKRGQKCGAVEKLRMGGDHNWCGAEWTWIQELVERG